MENYLHLKIFLKIMKSFIDDGSVTIVSTTADGFDGVYSTHGLSWGRDNIKNMYVNMCIHPYTMNIGKDEIRL